MAHPPKRSTLLNSLFGAQRTGDDPLRYKTARPPKLAHYALQSVRLVLIVVLGTSLFNGEGRLPLIGLWLAQTPWGIYAIWGGCLAILAVSEWFYERRAKVIHQP